MPRTKRSKLVSLTKTPKRNTRDSKASHIDTIREAAQEYPTIVVYHTANLRNEHLQEVRSLWKENSKLTYGKNKVVAKALGLDEESEVRPGLSGLSKKLQGPVGILFTKSSPEEVLEWFADYTKDDFARAGNTATQDVILPAGPVMMALDPPEVLPHSLEPQLRSLGMPTELKRGVPTLLEKFVVAKKGEALTSEKAQILKHLMIKDAKFRIIPIVHWTEEAGETREFPLSVEDERIISMLQKSDAANTMTGGKKTTAKKSKKQRKSAAGKGTEMDASMQLVDDDDDDDDEDMGSDEDFDDEQVGDKVTKSMMLPAGM